MNDRLQQLALFVRTVETGAPHEQLVNPASPSVSRAVVALESRLDHTTSDDQRYHDPCPYRRGDVPMVMGRLHDYAPKNVAETAPDGIDYELARLYYDIAGTAYPPAIAALKKLVPVTQILFGSDNPFVPLQETARRMKKLGLSAAELRAIGRDNAVALLPNRPRT
jgi:hypothetical protein